jgi:hypothetical protein
MPKIAKITINNERSEGDPEQSDNRINKEMLKELKNISTFLGNLLKNNTLQGAGLLGSAASGAGALGLGSIAGSVAGLGALFTGASASSTMPTAGYEKVMVEGEEKYALVNNATGEILDILTEQQAIDKGILDEKGNIKESMKVMSVKWDESTKDMAHYKDQLILSVEQLKTLSSLEAQQNKLQEDINDALRARLRRLSKNGGSASDYPSSGTPGFYDSESGIGYNSQGQGYCAAQQIIDNESQRNPSPTTNYNPYNDAMFTSSNMSYAPAYSKST